MTNHPNRSAKKTAASRPEPSAIRTARQAMGLSQAAAAAMIHSTTRTWEDWEAGKSNMHAGLWELFQIKCKALEMGHV